MSPTTERSEATTVPTPTTLQIEDCDVEYVDARPDEGDGSRTPIVLVHAGVFGSWFDPLAATAALSPYRIIRMRRAGYTGSPTPQRPVSIAEHAGHVAEVIRATGIERAHVVGHSSGSAIALQLAVDHPDLVGGLVLSEPPLVDALVHPDDLAAITDAIGPVIGAAIAAAAEGDVDSAFDTFMKAVCGPEYADVLRAALGRDGLERARADAGFFFSNEIMAMAAWQFDAELATSVTAPMLLVRGGDSPPVVHRLVGCLAAMVPGAVTATVPADDHLLPLRSPDVLAELVAEFVRAHPLTA